ncbi:pyridoxamine 5'-phosphate oxidase family protein [Runella sp.]|uniref:pyridoxamine 5'-phosphate oxidase family protein n=1 Tax=Runella sp. TaxID=1960881 RepID=UPI003D152D0B
MLTEISPEVIDHLLSNQYFGRMACSADNQVLIAPMMFCFDGRYIYGITREGTKLQMLRKNPNVAFEIDDMVSPGVWCSIVIQGEFEELQGEKREYAVYLLRDRRVPIFANETVGHLGENHHDDPKFITAVVYRIHIKIKTGRCYQQEFEFRPSLDTT